MKKKEKNNIDNKKALFFLDKSKKSNNKNAKMPKQKRKKKGTVFWDKSEGGGVWGGIAFPFWIMLHPSCFLERPAKKKIK